jgi:hypothetical protein
MDNIKNKTRHNKVTGAYILKQAKQIYIKKYLGGKCTKCGNEDFIVLDLHHVEQKDKNLNDIIGNRLSDVLKEVKKCILLCANCHQEAHRAKKDTKFTRNKRVYLEIKGADCCEVCGYKEYIGSLNFHHINPEEKEFCIGKINTTRLSDIKEKIEIELNKCKVLCRNCHRKEHFNNEKFQLLKEDIMRRVDTYTEPKTHNHSEIYEKWKSGKSLCALSKEYECSKSIIKYAIDKHNRV